MRGARRRVLAFGLGAWTLFAVGLVPAPASGAPDPSFVFGAAGDFGNSSNAQATFTAAGAAALDFFLAMGDTTYAEATEVAWCADFKADVPNLLIQAGNHDTGESTGANLNALLSACPYTLSENLTGRYGREWYFDYPAAGPLARFILTGCGTNFVVDGEGVWACAAGDGHYNFVANAIDAARNASIPWVVVGVHKNCISMGEKSCEIGPDFFGMLLSKRVDLVLQGHDHVYVRSKQLTCATPNTFVPGCVADDGSDGVYTKGGGAVVTIAGTGGRPAYVFNAGDTESGYFAAGFNGSFGFAMFTVTSTVIQMELVRAAGAANADSYRIEVGPDIVPPALMLAAPAEGAVTDLPTVVVAGTTDPGASVSANGVAAAVAANGSFSLAVALMPGPNTVTVIARDAAGNTAEVAVHVTFNDPIPALQSALAAATLQVEVVTAALQATGGELAGALANLTALQASGNATEGELARARASLLGAEANLSSIEADLENARVDLSHAQAAAAEALRRAGAVEANVTLTQADLVDAQADAARALAHAAQTEADLAATRAELTAAKADLEEAQARAQAAERAARAASEGAAIATFFGLFGAAAGMAALVAVWRARPPG